MDLRTASGWIALVLAPACDGAAPTFDPVPDDASGRLGYGEVRPCPDPLPEVAYAEVATDMGLRGDSDPDADHLDSGFAVVDDLDGDGDLDVVLGYLNDATTLYLREGDGFAASDLGIAMPLSLGLYDVDGDGRRDLLVTGAEPAVLYADGEGGFDAEPILGLPSAPDSALRELAPADIDGDGAVDLYAGMTTRTSDPALMRDYLLWGRGDGTFEVDTATLPDAVSGRKFFDAVWFDPDLDGDLDVYVVNDFGFDFGGNLLYRNDGGTLVDATEACACGLPDAGMGGDAGDFDGDARPDLYLTSAAHSHLLQALSDGSFVDVTQAWNADGVTVDFAMSWGGVWLDHDNDGLLDVLAAQGDLWDGPTAGIHMDLPIDLLRQGEGRFESVGAALGLDQAGSFRCVVALDHNDDGVLDPLVTEVAGPPQLYLSQGCTAAGWLEVDAPPGSRVEVRAGGRTQVSWSTTESGFGAARMPRVHFGLGAADTVDALRIDLPGGEAIAVEAPFEARRRVWVVDAAGGG